MISRGVVGLAPRVVASGADACERELESGVLARCVHDVFPMSSRLRSVARAITGLSASAIALACGGSLPTPPVTTHPPSAYIEVPYRPPAALVETVPEPAPEGAVWVDGHWDWQGRSYVWVRGGWLRAPEGAGYATWRSYMEHDGRLLFAPGVWYDARRQPMEAPRFLLVARTPPNEITLETEAPR